VSGRRAALTIVLAGFLTFGGVFTLLEFSRSQAAPAETQPPQALSSAPTVAADSLAPALEDGKLAVGVPISGSEALLRDVQAGDRLDILASLSSTPDAPPVTAVVVRGATVLRPVTLTDPLIVEVRAPEAMALAHLILRGTHLGYVVWAAGTDPASASRPVVDQTSVRRALGLSTPTEAAATPPPTATPAPTLVTSPIVTPAPRTDSGFLYQAQSGDTWESVATTFGLQVGDIRQWNEASGDEDPVPGTLLFIPRPS
jgi:hypothetical protein